MKKIFILKETFDFLCWKESPRSFYCRADGGPPRVIELIRALPGQAWIEERAINADPVRISRCLLLPPPSLGPNQILDGWQKVYVETQNVSRPFLTDADDEPLQKALDAYKAEQWMIYERRLKEAFEIKDFVERTLAMVELRINYEAPIRFIKDPYELKYREAQEIKDAAKRARAMERVRVKYEDSQNQAEDPPCFLERAPAAGILNLTLEMVKAGAAIAPSGLCLRDDHLASYWAQQKGADLDEMARQRREHFEWVQERAGNPGSIINLVKREKRGPFVPMTLSGLNDPRFLECCARVRFRCEFEDGTAIYLTDVKSATPEAREIEQLANLKASNFGAPGPGLEGRAAKQTGKQAKTSAEVSKQRSVAGKKKKPVQDPEDELKIKKAFFAQVEGRLSYHAAAGIVAEKVVDNGNPLGLKDGPYLLSVHTVKRIAGVKK